MNSALQCLSTRRCREITAFALPDPLTVGETCALPTGEPHHEALAPGRVDDDGKRRGRRRHEWALSRLCDCGPGLCGALPSDGRIVCYATYGGFGGTLAPFPRPWLTPMAAMGMRRLARQHRMQRIACPERDDWRQTAEACGFDFHTIDGERYWDERGYYAFTLEEIEQEIEAPTAEIDAMCLELVGRASATSEICGGCRSPKPLAADRGELGARRQEPLRPARPRFRRRGTGKAARIQCRYADLDLRVGGVSMDLARTGDRAAHHS